MSGSGVNGYYSPYLVNRQSQDSTQQPDPSKTKAEPDEKTTASPTTTEDPTRENDTQKPAPATTDEELTDQQLREVEKLQKRDMEVKAHELAHVAAGGQYINGQISFAYQTGPDGKRYAVGGEVSIDISAVPGDPEATIAKMQKVRQAALAPADPSSADRNVAAKAVQLQAQARMEAMLNQVKKNRDEADTDSPQTTEKEGSGRYEAQQETQVEKGKMVDIAA